MSYSALTKELSFSVSWNAEKGASFELALPLPANFEISLKVSSESKEVSMTNNNDGKKLSKTILNWVAACLVGRWRVSPVRMRSASLFFRTQ